MAQTSLRVMTRRLARTIVFAHTKYSSSLCSDQNVDVHFSIGLVCKYEENIENGKTGGGGGGGGQNLIISASQY